MRTFYSRYGFTFSLSKKKTNFDIINHQCRGDPLQNSYHYYETIFNSDFKGYKDCSRNQAMSSNIKAELDDIHFESDLLKLHIKLHIKKDLISNGFFVKNAGKKRRTDD